MWARLLQLAVCGVLVVVIMEETTSRIQGEGVTFLGVWHRDIAMLKRGGRYANDELRWEFDGHFYDF